ncbi:MAG: aldose 1-epimerase [Kiritimatiellia bacterium]
MKTSKPPHFHTEKISSKSGPNVSASVLPDLGANLVSFGFEGYELIYWDEHECRADGFMTGAFHMFPTPCRLKGCSYVFEGRRIRQRKHGKDVFIHGLIRDEKMSFAKTADSISCWLDIEAGHPVFEGFPFRCRIILTHTLIRSGVEVRFRLENKDKCRIPFGYGIHPFWRIYGSRKEVLVRIPCDHILELEESIPNGNIMPVQGTPYDLRSARRLDTVPMDCVLWRKKESESSEILLAAIKLRIRLDASEHFQHMILYAPPDKPYVCVENLTSSPNAPNLSAGGRSEVANLLVAEIGQTVEGWVRYIVERLP